MKYARWVPGERGQKLGLSFEKEAHFGVQDKGNKSLLGPWSGTSKKKKVSRKKSKL